MMRRLAWAALALLACCLIYGLVHERMFQNSPWTPAGVWRFIRFTVIFWAAAALILWRAPRWLGSIVAAFVLIYSVWWCSRYFEPWAPLATMYLLGSSYFLGRLVFRKAEGAIALLAGLAIWIFVIEIAVHFPVNTRAVYAGALAIPYLAAFRKRRVTFPTLVPASLGSAMLLYVLLAHWLVALKPEVSSDGLAVHLAIPAMIARDAGFTFDFHEHTWALMPIGGDFAFTAAYLLGGEAAARLLNFSMFCIIVYLIYQAARKWLSPDAAMLSCALFASTPLVQMVTGSLFVENVWAALILGATLAVAGGQALIGGMLLGAAMSVKLGTIGFVPVAIAVGWKRARPRTAMIAAAALFVVFAAPPYLNAWVKTRNPVFPFLNRVFKSPHFDTETNFVDTRYQERFTWKTPYEIVFRSGKFFEGRPGSLGFQYFLLIVPLMLVLNRGAPLALLSIAAGGAIFIFADQPNVRYLYPVLPLLSIGIAWLISEMPALRAATVAVIALNLCFLPAANWYHRTFALTRESHVKSYLTESAPQRELVQYLNRVAPGEPVAFFGNPAIAGLNGRAYTDTWHTVDVRMSLLNARDAAEVGALFARLGIRHVIAPDPVSDPSIPVQRFLETWTEPAGFARGSFAIRNVLPLPISVGGNAVRVRLNPGTYDDTDPRLDYLGAWLKDFQFPQTTEGSLTYSNVPGDTVSFSFFGDTLTYVYTKAANRGMAQVTIDGYAMPPLNLYSKETQWQARSVYPGLSAKTHTVDVQVLKRKDPASSNFYVDVDAFIIATQAPR